MTQNRSKKVLMTLLFGVILLIIIVVLEATNTTHFFHKSARVTFQPTPTTGGASANSQKGETSTTNSTTSDQKSNLSQPGDQKSQTGSSTVTNLLTPSGDFVSAHGTSDHPVKPDDQLASVCNTSPGAACLISFTLDGSTKSLAKQTTDRGGSTYWNSWTPKSIGLTPGTWQVKAIASYGTQTKEAADAMELVIGQ